MEKENVKPKMFWRPCRDCGRGFKCRVNENRYLEAFFCHECRGNQCIITNVERVIKRR